MMTRPLRFALLALALVSVLPLHAASCEDPIVSEALRVVEKANRSGALGRVVIAKNTAGEVRAGLVDFVLRLHPAAEAEDLLRDFQKRNASPVKTVPNGIDLDKYRQNDVIDWAAVTRDFPDTETIIELSRPGCDAAAGVLRMRYHYRTPNNRRDGVLMHFQRRDDGSWGTGRIRNSEQARWVRVDCTTDSVVPPEGYEALCRRYAGGSGAQAGTQAGTH